MQITLVVRFAGGFMIVPDVYTILKVEIVKCYPLFCHIATLSQIFYRHIIFK